MEGRPVHTPTLEELWTIADFIPNDAQANAIRHVAGPLYLTAGPGSGKTRVLLWRTLNLVVCCGVRPSEIFLSTFTEKAALQLREGLQSLLGIVTNLTGVNYDLGEMYIGTVHSLCRRLMTDRHVRPDRQRARPPHLLDDLDQYFHLGDNRFWPGLLDAAGLDSDSGNQAINAIFGDNSQSKHVAVSHCTAFFNRIAEEQIDPGQAVARLLVDRRVQDELAACQVDPAGLSTMLSLAVAYYQRLRAEGVTTFSLLQQHALDALQQAPNGRFRYIIIDEYQDTNAIQERLFFQLAQGHGNICVVGDDDQSLYRFRGATVENFVQFPQRCRDQLGVAPQRISLSTNYRSRSDIVDFYTRFIDHCDWRVEAGRNAFYRVVDKDIQAHRQDARPAVVATPAGEPMMVFSQIAALVHSLIDQGIVADPNQVARFGPFSGRLRHDPDHLQLPGAPPGEPFLWLLSLRPLPPRRVGVRGCRLAAVVDAVEENQFTPRSFDVLNEQVGGTRKTFGALVCLECDARFSCGSFRAYATDGRSSNDRAFSRYYTDYGPDAEQEEWRSAGLEEVL